MGERVEALPREGGRLPPHAVRMAHPALPSVSGFPSEEINSTLNLGIRYSSVDTCSWYGYGYG